MKKLFSAALIACAFGAGAMTPGGIEKKFIGLTFDVMNTSPSNVLAHADKFAEYAPFLDGVAIGLHDVRVVAGDGSVVTAQFHQIMSPTQRWTRDAVKDQLPYLKEIARKPHLEESLLLFWMTPVRGHRIRWDDDKGWANYAENMATVAWLAKQAGLKGLMLDPEEYSAQGGQPGQYIQTCEDPPFTETARLARQRGREVFSRVFKEFPDAVIFSLWIFWRHAAIFNNGSPTDPAQLSADEGELLPFYFNGMLDVIPPEARIVDGAEHYSLSATRDQYFSDSFTQRSRAIAFVAPENRAKYRAQLRVSNTHYLDMFCIGAKPGSHWYHGPVDGSRLEHFRLNVVQSLTASDEYVWLYGEHGGNWFDWGDGYRANKPRWEDVIPGMTETLLIAKDPDRFAADRKKALAKKGELKNLFASAPRKPVRFEAPESDTFTAETLASVKGVVPGELYSVTQHYRGPSREGSPAVSIVWRKNGKGVLERKSVPIPFAPGEFKWMHPESAIAIVPEGADELVVTASGNLLPGEQAQFGPTQIYLLDPSSSRFSPAAAAGAPSKPEEGRKWSYDAKEKMLTDGNWKLKAERTAKDGADLAVTACASGEGVLNFTNVKRDTGFRVVSIRGCGERNIVELVAPDVTEIGTYGFVFSKTIRKVTLSPDFEKFGARCFEGATNLVSFIPRTFPKVVKLEQSNHFLGCSALKGDFSFPNLETGLSGRMFAGSGIESVRIPKSANVGWNSLSGCGNLAYVEFGVAQVHSNDAARAEHRMQALKTAGALRDIGVARKKPESFYLAKVKKVSVDQSLTSVTGVKPGELYSVGASVKSAGVVQPHFAVRWKKDGNLLPSGSRPFAASGPREEGKWRSGAVLVRVPSEADELVLSVSASLHPGTEVEFRDFEAYKVGDPPPVWIDEFPAK
jgi:hypothetical protein